MSSTPISDDALKTLLMERLTSEEQQIYIKKHVMFLKFRNTNDFVVDLDHVIDDVGFSAKHKAKLSLTKNLELNAEYTINRLVEHTEISGVPATNKETILMTVRGFKKFCLLARTEQGKKTCDYFITMEEIVHEYMAQKHDDAIRNSSELARHNTLYREFSKCCEAVYVIIVKHLTPTSYVIKIGETHTDLQTRLWGLKTQYGMATLLDVWEIPQSTKLEGELHKIPMFKSQKYSGEINGEKGIEFYLVDEQHSYESFFRPVIKKNYEDHKTIVSRVDNLAVNRIQLERERIALYQKLLEAGIDVNYVKDMLSNDTVNSAGPSTSLLVVPEIIPVNTHRSTDRRIQQYDANLTLVAVHDGFSEAARFIEGGSRDNIINASNNNTLYKNYRWFPVNRDDKSSEPRELPPTVLPAHRSGDVAELTIDGKTIIRVHDDQVSASKHVGLRNASSITTAINRNNSSKGSKWMYLKKHNSSRFEIVCN